MARVAASARSAHTVHVTTTNVGLMERRAALRVRRAKAVATVIVPHVPMAPPDRTWIAPTVPTRRAAMAIVREAKATRAVLRTIPARRATSMATASTMWIGAVHLPTHHVVMTTVAIQRHAQPGRRASPRAAVMAIAATAAGCAVASRTENLSSGHARNEQGLFHVKQAFFICDSSNGPGRMLMRDRPDIAGKIVGLAAFSPATDQICISMNSQFVLPWICRKSGYLTAPAGAG
jgi:hypothetical protein